MLFLTICECAAAFAFLIFAVGFVSCVARNAGWLTLHIFTAVCCLASLLLTFYVDKIPTNDTITLSGIVLSSAYVYFYAFGLLYFTLLLMSFICRITINFVRLREINKTSRNE